MTKSGVTVTLATESDTGGILEIMKTYPLDFASYIRPLPDMIDKKQVFVIKHQDDVWGFAAFGRGKDPRECFTASARSSDVSHEQLSGDWIRSQLEAALYERSFRKFTAHVRKDNAAAIKMLKRNGYLETHKRSIGDLIELSKDI